VSKEVVGLYVDMYIVCACICACMRGCVCVWQRVSKHYITWSSVLLLIIAKGTSHTSVDPADHGLDPENGENIIFVIQSYMGSINMKVVKVFINHELSPVMCELTTVCIKNPGNTRAGLRSSVLEVKWQWQKRYVLGSQCNMNRQDLKFSYEYD
jgi:hypothetical protein